MATRAWGMESDTTKKTPVIAVEPSEYDRYVRARPANPTTTTTTTTTVPKKVAVAAPPSTATPSSVTIPGDDVWAKLRNCEAGGNYATNTGNGYYGAYQFSAPTWRSMGTAYEFAHLAPPEVQDDAAFRLQQRSGWGQWPACAAMLKLL